MDHRMLDSHEYDTLIEALTAWEEKDAAGEIFSSIIGSMVPSGDRRMLQATLRDERLKRDQEKKIRKERSILLKAKLLHLRDGVAAAEI